VPPAGVAPPVLTVDEPPPPHPVPATKPKNAKLKTTSRFIALPF
jgi:hypothetical protein